MAELACDVDLLVHDMALPERDVEHGDLHAKPSEVGRTASAARAGSLLLSHVMPELEDEKDDAERLVRSNFSGPQTALSPEKVTSGGPQTALSPEKVPQERHRWGGVVWFDAHGDLNTPETTTSGFLDGMPLAALTGHWWTGLAASIPGLSALPAQRRALWPPDCVWPAALSSLAAH
ncbi:MAG: arginase family protein [Geodermatophilaceae bacterium]